MTDTSKSRQPVVQGAHGAPFIYFDQVPSYGTMLGAIEITLTARAISPHPTGAYADAVVVAHLRCSPAAAAALSDALTKALEMLPTPVQDTPPPSSAIN